jgi:hypothetical protein
MADQDKDDLKIELSPEAQAKLKDAPPDIKAKMQELFANFHQAMDAIKRGEHETFEDAMEAITGNRPEKLDLEHAKVLLGGDAEHMDLSNLFELVVGGPAQEDDILFADGGIILGLCGSPTCFCIHYGLKDERGMVFADGKLKLEDVPILIAELEHLAETLKQKQRPS